MSSRQAILDAIRRAPGARGPELVPPGPPPEAAEYRHALARDRVDVFVRRLEELGVYVHRLEAADGLVAVVARLCEGRRTYVEPALQKLREALAEVGVPVVGWEDLAEAEVGVTGADYAVAESGTLVLLARPDRPRSGSLLPPVHVAVVGEDRVLADLFDLVEHLRGTSGTVVLASGPSRSADIEMSLAVGVHGPGVVHVVLLPGQEGAAGPAK